MVSRRSFSVGGPSRIHPAPNHSSSTLHYVYILQSKQNPDRHYIGCTGDLKRRLKEHNSRNTKQTSEHAPWRIKSYFAFDREEVAHKFEKYLKSGSGREFSKRHFI